MILKTRSKKKMHLTSLDENVLDNGYEITDAIYAISLTPMFAGQTAKVYTYAEHSCHIFDYIKENMDELLTIMKPKTNYSLIDLTKKQILLYSLMHYMAYPFLLAKIETHGNFERNNSRILSGFLKSIGHEYRTFGREENNPCYIKAEKVIKYAAEMVKKEVVDENYYNKDARYMYHEPCDVLPMFISRFNEVSDMKFYLLNKSIQTDILNYHLQKIKML
jgi:hypothetical protein